MCRPRGGAAARLAVVSSFGGLFRAAWTAVARRRGWTRTCKPFESRASLTAVETEFLTGGCAQMCEKGYCRCSKSDWLLKTEGSIRSGGWVETGGRVCNGLREANLRSTRLRVGWTASCATGLLLLRDLVGVVQNAFARSGCSTTRVARLGGWIEPDLLPSFDPNARRVAGRSDNQPETESRVGASDQSKAVEGLARGWRGLASGQARKG